MLAYASARLINARTSQKRVAVGMRKITSTSFSRSIQMTVPDGAASISQQRSQKRAMQKFRDKR